MQFILYAMISVNSLEFPIYFIIDLNFVFGSHILMNISVIQKQIKFIELLTVDINDTISMNRSTNNFPAKLFQFFIIIICFILCSLVPSNLIMNICVNSV